jgi:uncharacterized protein
LPPQGSLQMALLPEEEAAAVAERMWSKGHKTVAMLTSNDEFGQRVAAAFTTRFKALGGSIGEQASFNNAGSDHSSAIRVALGVTDSLRRIDRVRAIVGLELTAQPARRYDLDALFLAARPAPARLLVPQLKAFDTSDWPILATSHIYSGSPNAALDRDLSGVEFCDAPWILGVSNDSGLPNRANVSALPTSVGAGGRLLAYGMDAYRVASFLTWMESNPNRAIRGATGLLNADQNGSVRRVPIWARFVDGLTQVSR